MADHIASHDSNKDKAACAPSVPPQPPSPPSNPSPSPSPRPVPATELDSAPHAHELLAPLHARITELEAELIAREPRLFRSILDFLHHPHRRKPAARAIVFGLFSGRTVIAAGTSVTAVASVFVAALGLRFASNANDLIRAQNSLIEGQTQRLDAQTYLADAARSNVAQIELASIIAELKSKAKSIEELEDRIRFTAAALRPIRALEFEHDSAVPTLAPRARSLERGQLLLTLLDIDAKANKTFDFSFADLRSSTFTSDNLSDANLRHADFSNASLRGVNMRWAELDGTCFRGALLDMVSFEYAQLRGADFSDAILFWPDFDNKFMPDRNLAEANFDGAMVILDPLLNDLDDAWSQICQWPGFEASKWRLERIPDPENIKGQLYSPCEVLDLSDSGLLVLRRR